jgi:stress response protein YsnF
VIPVVEEIIVKRYVLKEEILVTKERTARQEPQTFTLRREEVTVERLEGDVTPDSNNRQQGETQ